MIKNDIKESTYYLMSRLRVEYDYDFYFMIGTDNVIDIKNWINCEKLLGEVKFFIIERQEHSFSSNLNLFKSFIYLKTNIKEASSTEIRNNFLNKDLSVNYLYLNKSVLNYIITNKLYGI